MGIRSGGGAIDGDIPDVDPSTIEVPDGFELVDGGPLAKRVDSGNTVSLMWCPACGHPFEYGDGREFHLEDHGPEDFGLG